MNNPILTARLIVDDIVATMSDYTSLQPDIDPQKVNAAAIVAQDLDIKRIIGADNLSRVETPTTPEDTALKDLVIPALCYYTYSRLLKMFQGVMTDGGLLVEATSESINTAKSLSNTYSVIGDQYITEVIDFLKAENPSTEADDTKLTPQIRIFGGEENLASN